MTPQMDKWIVIVEFKGERMSRIFDYLPYAEKQAETWRRMYEPEGKVTVMEYKGRNGE